MKKLKYKHDYDEVTEVKFQQYAHDRYLGSTAHNADELRIRTEGSGDMHPEKTWKNLFAVRYASLGELLKSE